MFKRFITIFALCAGVLALSSGACQKDSGLSIPAPPTPSGGGGGETPGGGGETPGGEDDAVLCTDIGQTPIVLAYYTENSPALPDVTLLTHINYAHGRFVDKEHGDGGIYIEAPTSNPNLFRDVIDLKSRNPRLKVMLMIGGWGDKADGFSMMARDATKRKTFCTSVKSLLDTYGFDGVDIDWEYPTQTAGGVNGASPDDTQNFNLVLKELRETLGTSKIISYASSSSAAYVDWPTAMKYLDYVNVMTYDMGAAPHGHNSPLYRSGNFAHRSCDESIQAHFNKGIPYNRMNLGVPFYGKSEKEQDETKRETPKIYPYEVKYNQMAKVLAGTFSYTYKGTDGQNKTVYSADYNIRKWDPIARVPYLVDKANHIMLSYDDPESVDLKGKYAVGNGLLGAMCWEYRHDDDNQSLLKALVKAMYGKESVLDE